MGGHRGGATASQTAIAAIGEIFDAQTSSRAGEMLSRAIGTANERVWEIAQNDPELEGMGTTVVALHLDAEKPRERPEVRHEARLVGGLVSSSNPCVVW